MAEIKKCRDNVWKTVESRKHNISKVYVNDPEGLDLLFLGEMKNQLKDGKIVVTDFVGRLLLERQVGDPEAVRVKLYQAAAFSGGNH
jgi:hypothetical protein